MAVVFLLGPGTWAADEAARPEPPPMATRRRLAAILVAGGHRAFLMEDDPDRAGEDLIRKFDRLLRSGATDVLLYWPPLAKMQTTYDELILLCDRKELIEQLGIAIWVLHHVKVAAIAAGTFRILEKGGRSRYLTAVAGLGVHPLEWETDADLDDRVRLLAAELD
ncbi:MAG: hypothetical protein QG573_2056 [Acidobacteriota bacterium]|nr:hypothetical protein [Acidobacteriota bacterium]